MFKSPLHYCRVRDVWVALDMSVGQCRAMNGCPAACPYKTLFAAVDEMGREFVVRCKAPLIERRVAS